MTARRRWAALAAAGAIGYAWCASGTRTFTHPAEVLTFVPGLLVLVLTLLPAARRRDRPRVDGRRRFDWLPWLVLLMVTVALELVELFAQPRSAHPTLSSLTNALIDTRVSKFLAFAAWLLLGWLLVSDLGRRTPRDGDADTR